MWERTRGNVAFAVGGVPLFGSVRLGALQRAVRAVCQAYLIIPTDELVDLGVMKVCVGVRYGLLSPSEEYQESWSGYLKGINRVCYQTLAGGLDPGTELGSRRSALKGRSVHVYGGGRSPHLAHPKAERSDSQPSGSSPC